MMTYQAKYVHFSDDTTVFRTAKTDADKDTLQDDLTNLVKWSEKWQLLFNFGKCKCSPIGHVNASSVNMFKNKIDNYLARAGYT